MATSSTESSPSPAEIIDLANLMGYKQRRPAISSTLFFEEENPDHDMPPCLINIYYTTRSIMTFLNHPSAGSNELWRSNAYKDLDDLKEFFLNPRTHTKKGYRNKDDAIRGCVGCGEMKKRNEFSQNQWRRGPDSNKCKDCVERSLALRRSGTYQDEEDEASSDFPSLTQDLLEVHNRIRSSAVIEKKERRQFNCPECPKHGRPNNIFFKKVPVSKPIVKCPQCKRVTRGRCQRLYPIPKGSEKGYGLYKCTFCNDTWGSSRAVGNIAQECYNCSKDGVESLVTPFRIEMFKKKTGGERSGGRRTKRVPKEPIKEGEEDERSYGENDQRRHDIGAGNSLARNRNGARDGSVESSERSYDIVSMPRSSTSEPSDSSSLSSPSTQLRSSRIPKGYKHKCAGCASGICKNRKIPKSEVHDVSDGNTVSTSASVVTNSSIDKSDFNDRDEDFSRFDGYQDEEEWVTIGV